MFERRHPHAHRTALVTGGARGIGRATAEALLADGMQVAIADLDEVTAAHTAKELASRGTIRAYGLDVTDYDAFTALVARVEQDLGPIDVLVNNAGIMPLGPFLDLSTETDRLQVDINVHGVIFGMRAVLPGMLERGRGHIVNLASGVGRAPAPFAAVYTATKHAVVGLTEAVRGEHLDDPVRFSYVLPGLVKTELISGAGAPIYPPAVTPEHVAERIVEALYTRKVEVYVPRFVRVGQILPAILPRRVVEAIAIALKFDQIFAHVDTEGRRSYRERVFGRRNRKAENE